MVENKINVEMIAVQRAEMQDVRRRVGLLERDETVPALSAGNPYEPSSASMSRSFEAVGRAVL